LSIKPIRVMYDEQIFLLQEYGGISRYFTELIKAFEANPDLGVQPVLASDFVLNKYLLTETKSLTVNYIRSKIFAAFLLFLRMALKRKTKEPADIVHHTFYLPGFFGRFRGTLKAVTLFDMIPENTDSQGRFWNPHFAKKGNLANADLVFSISESSTKDMRKEYGFELRVVTTYLGVGSEYSPNLSRLDWQSEKYFLFVGNRAGYKDFDLAIRAFATVTKDYPEVCLQLVGGGKVKSSEKKLAAELGVGGLISHRSVKPDELPNVYANALALVYPSRYEGFGLPLAEAMASGVPIIAADTPINNEIASRSASFFPIGSQSALANLMFQVIINPESFRDKIEEGKKRALDFTWHSCAEQTAAEYRKLVNERKERVR
jgi:glycosyltransferase involved in cell wall biosynthesis